jgi:hypothetical protein
MTREGQKRRERFFVEEAAKLLGKTWDLGQDREHPDFLVTDGAQRFGLEVSELFKGPQGESGSAMKQVGLNGPSMPFSANTRPSRMQPFASGWSTSLGTSKTLFGGQTRPLHPLSKILSDASA